MVIIKRLPVRQRARRPTPLTAVCSSTYIYAGVVAGDNLMEARQGIPTRMRSPLLLLISLFIAAQLPHYRIH